MLDNCQITCYIIYRFVITPSRISISNAFHLTLFQYSNPYEKASSYSILPILCCKKEAFFITVHTGLGIYC